MTDTVNRAELIAAINQGIASGDFISGAGAALMLEEQTIDCRQLYSANQLYVQRFSAAYLAGYKWGRDGATDQDPDDPDLFMPGQNTDVEDAAFRDGYRHGLG